MKTIHIAVGSTRSPKLNAVREALAVIASRLHSNRQFDIASVDVPSGVRHTPLSREDMMIGARHRAEELVRIAQAKNEPWNYFVGLEGGLDVVRDGCNRRVFLQNWAYVTDGTSQGAFGQSGAVLLPESLVRRVVDEGVELSEAIDAFAGGHGIRDAQGAWGILTNDIITRQDAFRIAVIGAFTPFFNRQLYDMNERKCARDDFYATGHRERCAHIGLAEHRHFGKPPYRGMLAYARRHSEWT